MLLKTGAISVLFYAGLILPGLAQDNNFAQANGDDSLAAGVQRQYNLFDLGIWGSVAGINDRGQVAGKNNANGHAFLWEHGTVTDLGALGPDPHAISQARGINGNGEVVGISSGTGPTHSFLWRNGRLTDIGVFYASGINDRDEVAGYAAAGAAWHAVLWYRGKITDLGTLGGENSFARCVNNLGQVAGDSNVGVATHGFLWRNGKMIDLGTLGGDYSQVAGINDRAQVVGSSLTSQGEGHGFIWEHGKMTDIGKIYPVAINNRGQVTGDLEVGFQTSHAVLWDHGVITDLGTLSTSLNDSHALGMNNRAQVVGYANGGSIDGEVFIARPVRGPE